MNKKTTWTLKAILIVAMFGLSLALLPSLPERVPIHWNVEGKIDGYGDRNFGAFFVPVLSIVLAALFAFIPRLDPKKKNYEQFMKAWEIFQIAFLIFMLYLHSITLYLTFHPEQSMTPFMLIGIGILFVVMGNYMGKVRQNYFFGIRTPWTLDNEEVWNKTQRLGGWCFVISGLLFLINAYFQTLIVIQFFVSIIIAAVIPIVYSYVIYKRIKPTKS